MNQRRVISIKRWVDLAAVPDLGMVVTLHTDLPIGLNLGPASPSTADLSYLGLTAFGGWMAEKEGKGESRGGGFNKSCWAIEAV